MLGMAPWMGGLCGHLCKDPNHRCLWVTCMLTGRVIGFRSIYAPSLLVYHVCLWNSLTNYLPDAEWILLGDFNIVELEGDRESGLASIITSK